MMGLGRIFAMSLTLTLAFGAEPLMATDAAVVSEPSAAQAKPQASEAVKSAVVPPKEDCGDTKPKVSAAVDPKTVEQKAAEDQALQKLGLITPPAAPVAVKPLVPVATIETCK